jgi:hypothetical protein
MDKRLEDMCRSLKSLGAEVADLQLPDLDACELDSHIATEPFETGEDSDKSPENPPGSRPDNS